MDWKKVSSFIIVLLNAFGISQAYFETPDTTYNIAAGQTLYITSPGYSSGYGYTPGSSAKYIIVAPVEYQVRASCDFTMYDPSNGSCSSERFYFAVDGKKDLTTSTYYCGSNKTVANTSIGNQLVLAYISTAYSGYFVCTVTTVCDCGWSVSSRIVGGSSATPNEFPPMATLVSIADSKIYCGATVVSSKFVVTAAHCLRVTPFSNTAILVGEHDISMGADSNYTAIYLVKQFIPHPAYSTATNLNDIGLVESQKAILWSKAVAPVCLPIYYTSADFSGEMITATGWGTTSYGGLLPKVLQKVNLNVLSNTNTQCKNAYPSLDPSQMCTFTAEKDTCQYDSGGPLFYRRSTDPRLFLIGLVSLGNGCASEFPALNSRLTSFLAWIESVIGPGTLCRRVLA